MALSKDWSFHGVTFPGAYIKVSQFSGTKAEMRVTVLVSAARGEDPFHVAYYDVPVDLDAGNPVTQAYDWLKANHPDFDGAEDVLVDPAEEEGETP